MTDRNEIIDEVIELLHQHKDKLRGTIHQDPYKGDFFRLFAAAFNAGMMSRYHDCLYADALVDAIRDRAPDVLDTPTWHTLYAMWGAWTYAWQRANELHLSD
jgi:hypothetical protein